MASFADLLNPRSKPSSPSSSPAPSAGRAHFDPARDEARSSSGAGADQVGQSGHGEHRIGESGADRDVEGSWQPPRRSSMNISQLLSPTNVVASLAPAGGDEGRDLSPEEDAERQTLQNNEAAQSAGTKRKRASQAHAHKAARSQDQESHTEDAMSAQTLAQETNSGSPSSQPLEGSSDHARAGAQLSPTDMHAQRPNEYVPSLAPPKKKAKNWGAGGPNRQPSSSIPPSQLDQQSAEADAAQTLASVGTAATAERSAETAEPSVHESSEVVRLSPGSQASEYAPHSSREQQAMPIPAPRSISYISHGSPAHESSSTSGIPTGSQEPEVPKTKRKHPNQHTYRKKSQEAVQQPESAAATQSPSSNRSPVQQSPAVSGEGTSAPPKPKHPNQYTYRKKETIANSPAEDGGNRSPGSSTASAPSGTTDAPGAPGATKGKSAASEGAGKSESGASKPKHPNQWTYRKKDDPSRPKQPNQYTYRNKERETSASANGAGSSSSSKKSRAEREASVASSNDQGPSASPSSSTMKVENESGTAAATPQKRKQPNQYTYRNKEAKAGDEASPVTEAAPPKKKHANQYTKAAAAAAAAAEDAAAPPKPKHPNQWTYRNKDKEREASASSAGGDGGDSPAPPSKPKHPNQYTYRSKGSSEASEVSARAAAEKEKRERREEAERRRREEEEERQRREEEEAEKERRLREGEEEDKLYCICKTLYDDEKMMIACDRCDEWYHTSCMGMKDEQAELVDMFVCPHCEPLTSDRTTWKPKCLRPGCTHASFPPLSRYCSERCGLLLAVSRIQKTKYVKQHNTDRLFGRLVRTARKREGMVVWNAAEVRDEEWFKKFAPSTDMPISSHGSEANGVNGVPSADGKEADLAPTKLTMASSKEDEELLVLQKRLDRLLTRRASVNRTLDLLVARSKLLTLAEDRISTLPPIRSAADDTAPRNSKKSKSKSGGGDANNGGGSRAGPRCGYDERLSWDDERWGAWIGSETGQRVLRELEPLDGHLSPGSPEEENEQTQSRTDERGAVADEPAVCGVPRRKCARHADWSVVRGADFEVEREVQTNALSTLADEERELRMRLEDLQEAVRAQAAAAAASDAALAAALAREGPRRAGMVNGR